MTPRQVSAKSGENPSVPSILTKPLLKSEEWLATLIEREKLRTKIEAAVARLIDALDAIDGPAEDLEPYLAGGYNTMYPAAAVDCEADSGAGISDDEPSLGWTPLMDQERAMHFTAEVGPHEGEFGGDTVADPDLEDSHGAEAVNEDGGDINDEPHDDYPIEPNATGVCSNAGALAHA